MTVTIRLVLSPIRVEILGLVTALESLMSLLDDLNSRLDTLATTVDEATTRVRADVAVLKDRIVALEAQIAEGSLSPTEQDAVMARIDELQAKVAAIDPTDPTVLP